MQANPDAQKRTKVSAILLIVFSVLGCGNIFTILEAIFALVGAHQDAENWGKWKKVVRIMFIIGLIASIICTVCFTIICISYFVIYADYVSRGWYYNDLAAAALTSAIIFIFFLAFASVQISFCIRTHRCYCDIYSDGQGYTSAPAVGYPGTAQAYVAVQPPAYAPAPMYAPQPQGGYPPQGVYGRPPGY